MKSQYTTIPLWDICNFINGRAFKPTEWSNKWLPIIRIQNLNNANAPFNYCNFEVPEKIHVKKGDLLVSWSWTPWTSFGAFVWEWVDAVLNQHIFKTEIDQKIVDTYYLKMTINSILDQMIEKAHWWAGLQHITKKELESIQIPLPPLATQKAIVAKLDEAAASIQLAKASIQSQIDDLERLWQSSLSDVFEGNYTMKLVDELCLKITDWTHSTPKYIDQWVPFLSVKNVTWWIIDFSDTRFISQEEHNQLTKRCKPELNDLLYTKVWTTWIAKVIDVDCEFSIFVSLALLKPKHDIINVRFFEYMLNSPKAYEQSQSRTRWVANRNLVINDIKQIQLPLPPLSEQHRIITHLDQLSHTMNRLKAQYQSQLTEYDNLWSSILDQAFKGELVKE